MVEGDRVALDQSSIDVDVVEFERLASRDAPRALEQAAALYVGDLLDGLDVNEELFEEWLRGERARLRETAVHVLTRLVPHQAKSGTPELAIQTAVRLLALDPLREETHRTLMRLYARQGRLGDALRQYQACVSDRTDLTLRPLGRCPASRTAALRRGSRAAFESGLAGGARQAVAGARGAAQRSGGRKSCPRLRSGRALPAGSRLLPAAPPRPRKFTVGRRDEPSALHVSGATDRRVAAPDGGNRPQGRAG